MSEVNVSVAPLSRYGLEVSKIALVTSGQDFRARNSSDTNIGYLRARFCTKIDSSLSFNAKRLKLCMQPRLMRALFLSHVRPASMASEAVS